MPRMLATANTAIIADVKDAWQRLRGEGGKRLGIDPGRLAVADGYLALVSGVRS